MSGDGVIPATAAEASDRATLLRALPLYDGLSTDELRRLAMEARAERVARGRVLFEQGAPADAVWVLRRGAAKLLQAKPDGRPFVLRVVGPGEVLGADALAREPRYGVTAQTLCWSEALVWSEGAIARLMEAHPCLAVNALQILSGRIEELRARYRELATERVEQRLGRTLLRVCGHLHAVAPAGGDGARVEAEPIELPLSRRDLAELAGTTLFTVSRIVRAWERSGIVRAGRMRVTILRPGALGVEETPAGPAVEAASEGADAPRP
jgi:CRP-like cAMP-binding protein